MRDPIIRDDRRGWSTGDIVLRVTIFVLAAVILMALQITGRLTPVQSAITQLTSPAQLGATNSADTVADWIQFVTRLGEQGQRISALEEINATLLAENFRLNEVELENQQLRELLAFADTRPDLEVRGSQIVARKLSEDTSNFQSFIVIDLGSDQGIAAGMPVVTNAGLVGRVTEVAGETSKVLLITDPNSGVNATLSSSRVDGVIRGLPGGQLIMDYIPQGAQFSIGEIILTSGVTIFDAQNELIGSGFPKNIPIGQVVEIQQRDEQVSQQAFVVPAVSFDEIDLVLVITNFDPQAEAPPELLNDDPTDASAFDRANDDAIEEPTPELNDAPADAQEGN